MIVDIIIPTYENANMLIPCLQSIMMSDSMLLNKAIIINNGHCGIKQFLPSYSKIELIQMKKNVGWEGGLIEGLKHSKTEFVMFLNDDVHILPCSNDWLQRMIYYFKYPDTSAVGPCSNVVMGLQNIFQPIPYRALDVTYLVGFCMLLKRKDLDSVGGVDDSLRGGDDIDLSIRLKDAGKRLIALRDIFVFHHGFKTGQKVHGNYWNSKEMIEKTNYDLIRKHGLKKWHDCIIGYSKINPIIEYAITKDARELERNKVKECLKEGTVLELGCGSEKTVDDSIGIDRVPKGQMIDYINEKSVADIIGNVENALPLNGNKFDNIIARHLLEHCINPLKTITLWTKHLTDRGRLIIAVPDQRIGSTIPLCPEHVHAFTPESLDTLMESIDFMSVDFKENYNNVTFIKAYERKHK